MSTVRRFTAATAIGSFTLGRRFLISMRRTRAQALTFWSQIASGKRWGWTPPIPCTTFAGGEDYDGQFVWVFEISGAVPPSHLTGGYHGAVGMRQHARDFPLGGSKIRGVGKPGEAVWSRIYVAEGRLHLDIGLATIVELPQKEAERRWNATNPEWPLVSAVLHGITRDQMMARHKSNHIQIAYGEDKASAFEELGVEVHLCGEVAP